VGLTFKHALHAAVKNFTISGNGMVPAGHMPGWTPVYARRHWRMWFVYDKATTMFATG
jgi:hypothetical protein